jgi:predicted porin
MNKVLLTVMLLAALYLTAHAQSEKKLDGKIFEKLEVTKEEDTVSFTFHRDGKAETVNLINGKDNLKTSISGKYDQPGYALEEDGNDKTLHLYLPLKLEFPQITGIAFGKTYWNGKRIQ